MFSLYQIVITLKHLATQNGTKLLFAAVRVAWGEYIMTSLTIRFTAPQILPIMKLEKQPSRTWIQPLIIFTMEKDYRSFVMNLRIALNKRKPYHSFLAQFDTISKCKMIINRDVIDAFIIRIGLSARAIRPSGSSALDLSQILASFASQTTPVSNASWFSPITTAIFKCQCPWFN